MITGVVRISAVTASNSLSSKTVSATCPAGKQILGGGAAITGGLGEVNLIGYRPVDSTLGSFIASATEDADGLNGNWTLTAYAACGDPIPAPTPWVWVRGLAAAGGTPTGGEPLGWRLETIAVCLA